MSYETQVTVFVFSGDPLTVTGTLWECWNQIGRPDQVQVPEETEPVANGTNGRVVFASGPDYLSDDNHAIALSLEDNMPGKIFRSGVFINALPPGASSPGGPVPAGSVIEALVADAVTITPGMIDEAMPALPYAVTSDTTITTIPTPLFATNDLTVTVVGITTHDLPAPVVFTYTVHLNFVPSLSQFDLGMVIEVAKGESTISFTGGTSIASGIEAFVLNLIGGIVDTIVSPNIVTMINAAANAAALAQAAAIVGQATGTTLTTLPAGVVLSARRIAVTSTDIIVLPALGAYGGLFNKLFPTSGGGGSISLCPVSSLALIYGAALRLDAFRQFRDARLLTSASGRYLSKLYYEHGPEVASLLAREPEIRKRAMRLSEQIDKALRDKCPILSEFENDARILVSEIAAKASPGLRSAARALLGLPDLARLV